MKTLRVGICCLVAFSVLAHGVVEPWSEAVLEIGAALLLVWWASLFAFESAPLVRWNALLAPVAALWSVAVLQYFLRITAVPFLTKIEILKYSALVILSFLAVQAFQTLEDWRGFAWFVLVLGFAVSLFGILQYFTFNGKLYWFRVRHYGGIPFGPYVNRNHFAGFVELVVPLGLSILVLRAEDHERISLVAILTLLPIGALFVASSRGGIIGFFIELGLVMILAFLRERGRTEMIAAAIVLLLAGALVAWLGVGPALDRFTAYRNLEVSESRRAEMLKDSWRIFLDHPIAGTGLGTLQAVFPRYETLYDGNTVDHTHNDYVEALAETGVLGGLIGAAFLVLFFRESWLRLTRARNVTDRAFHIGAFSACCALLSHSFIDFNLHIPSNALLFLLMAILSTSAIASDAHVRIANRGQYKPITSIAIDSDLV